MIALAALMLERPDPVPVLWIASDGTIRAPHVRMLPGTGAVQAPGGTGFQMMGPGAGFEIPDDPALRLTKSLTVSTWLFVRQYTNEHNSAPGAQVIFRGDDRSGLDPYHLTVLADGTIAFAVENERNQGAVVNAPFPLFPWTHVTASLNDGTGQMSLYLNGALVAQTVTNVRPYADLDRGARPGVGIGNVQAASGGAHNQPLHGTIADFRLYDRVVSPSQAGWAPRMVGG